MTYHRRLGPTSRRCTDLSLLHSPTDMTKLTQLLDRHCASGRANRTTRHVAPDAVANNDHYLTHAQQMCMYAISSQ